MHGMYLWRLEHMQGAAATTAVLGGTYYYSNIEEVSYWSEESQAKREARITICLLSLELQPFFMLY